MLCFHFQFTNAFTNHLPPSPPPYPPPPSPPPPFQGTCNLLFYNGQNHPVGDSIGSFVNGDQMLPINTVEEDKNLECYAISQPIAPPPLQSAVGTLDGITVYIHTKTILTSFPSGNVLVNCDDINCLDPGPTHGQYCNPHLVIREDGNSSSTIILEIDLDGFDVCSIADPEPDLKDCIMEIEHVEYSPDVEYLYHNNLEDSLKGVVQTSIYSPRPPPQPPSPPSPPPSPPPPSPPQ